MSIRRDAPRTRAVYGNPSSPLAETTLNYNQVSLPATLTHQWNGSQLDIGYQYNADRQKTRVTLSDKSFAPPALPDSNQTYKSNHLNQYTTINDSVPEYDKRGNLIRHGEWSYVYEGSRVTGQVYSPWTPTICNNVYELMIFSIVSE
ncbi:hypothetical protein XNC1_2915 [Xenorhabdus nematophila ATCC 19061]|uniref:Uncharacterized protein n=1 Tax=Xenorhabdus nematophila (strain ATCC 19061 / DSM 3370 / CCUG 14189 / LMG 1036 / NCIMB 9965 / AN6) TaxID=406817 RepID=D3VJR0_XENNA|nr:hypothetical protein [Xenorhabdus nematophila]CBJ90969.1 hypothetical protein XNC1_2915 [Xenorhabdus nematophila ATCC 19061]CEK23795.1 hypothetical protein XNC2_2801 [Xenorhabdus nematophila AN6/1]